jgi:VWFA-related protein
MQKTLRLSVVSFARALSLFWCGALAIGQQGLSPRNEQDTQLPTFRSNVNLVLVPVVVRDGHGRSVGNLARGDFQLFDNGKRQSIAAFSAIRHRSPAPNDNTVGRTASPQGAAASVFDSSRNGGPDQDSPHPPRNFIYIFDDLNIRFGDLARVRGAAATYFKNNFSAGDRAAIYTLSRGHSLDFTSDREKLETAVSKLQWGTVAGHGGMGCPDVSYYIADRIVEKADSEALDGLTLRAIECAHVRPDVARHIAMSAANREIILGREGTKLTLSTLQSAIRRLSRLPGERVIVFVSPGFFAQTAEAAKDTTELLELAARNNVIIHGLGVRGVIMAEEEEDVTRRAIVSRRMPPSASSPGQAWIRYQRESARADGDVMKDLAEGTGGTFFHNNSDLLAGFERLAAIPEFSYVLGFSPSEFEADGSFHHLKVRLVNERHTTVEARRGYYSLTAGAREPQATTELEDAVFSRVQRSEIPVVLQIGYSKPSHAAVVKAYVVARIDITPLDFEKFADRNHDSLDVVVALFDSEGGYVTNAAETENLSLDDQALGKEDPAVTLRWDFPGVKPGDYVVRFGVREPKTGATTIIDRTLKIL